MYSNELNKEAKFHNKMLKCEHILSVRRALKRQLSLTLTLKGKNSPGRQETFCAEQMPTKQRMMKWSVCPIMGV